MPIRRLLALAFLAYASATAEVRSLTILHTNDLHARLKPLDNGSGGFAYVAAALRHEREGCRDCLLLNAGDLVQGSPVSSVFRGLPIFGIANLFGFDAATLGNHDFDYGWEQTRRFTEVAVYPVVSSNLVNARGELLTSRPYVVLKVNGLRVAVIGAMTDTLASLTTPKAVGDWHSLPVVATARRYAAEVRPVSDLIVLLGHITKPEEQAFLDSAPEIPVLVTGHVHDGLQQPLVKGDHVAVRVKSYGEEIGRLELQVDTGKKAPVSFAWKHIRVDPTLLTPAPDVAAAVDHWESEVTERVDQPLAVSKRAFNKAEVKKLLEQALREETGADFAHVNLGGVRDVLPAGQLRVRHIWDLMPFENEVLIGSFKGRDLPPVVVGDRQIDPDRVYTLAVSDYTAANQQTQENLRTTGLQFPRDAGLMRDILIDWFRKKRVIE
jgi:2',3'-cyclic-nucleotide 2'-phosphodiesterase (5'-nucleotidase family)